MHNLPQPINGTEQYLKAILDELAKMNQARTTAALASTEVDLVALKEPAKRKAPGKKEG